MKLKKVLLNVLALATVAGGVAGLAACAEEKPTPTDTPSSETAKPSTPAVDKDADKKKVQAALNALTVAGEATEGFTLSVTGNGGVNIAWTSDKPEVIKIEGANAIVTRPGFGAEAATVKLTATAVSGSYSENKEFTVTVAPLVDQSKKISDIKALDDDTVVEARGVVTGFLHGDDKGQNVVKGFYLTDDTGTTYVFGSQTAATLKLGNEVYFKAKKTTYNNAPQLSYPENVVVLNEEKAADWSGAVSDKTINELHALPLNDLLGNTYEMLVKVYKNNKYGDYKIEALDYDHETNDVAWSEYYSGGNKADNPEYAKLLKGNEDKTIRVIFYVAGKTKSGAPRGNVLAVLPLNAEDQSLSAKSTLASAIDALGIERVKTADPVTLPTTLEGLDKVSVTYALKDGSKGGTLAENVLTCAPTAAIQKLTLVATIKVEGIEATQTYEYTISVAETFEATPIKDVFALAEDSDTIVQGKVLAVSYKTAIITDGTDIITVYEVKNVKIGDYIKVYGKTAIKYACFRVVSQEVETIEPLEITDPVAEPLTDELANAILAEKTVDIKKIEVVGILSAKGDYDGTINILGKDYKLEIKNISDEHRKLVGKTVTVVCYVNDNYAAGKKLIGQIESVTEKVLTDAEKVDTTIAVLEKQLNLGTLDNVTTVTLDNPLAVTIAAAPAEGATTLAYADGKLTITPVAEAKAENLVVTVTSGEVTKNLTVTINSLKNTDEMVEIVCADFGVPQESLINPTTVKGDVTINYTKTSGNGIKYWHDEMRVYAGSSIEITSTKKIHKIVFTEAGGKLEAADTVTTTGGEGTMDIATHTWTGDATSVKIDNQGSQFRFSKITVYLAK